MPTTTAPNVLLVPGDHYVLKKLSDELLPWMIAGRKLGRRWFVRLSGFYGYTADLAAALAGLGIGTPIAALASGKTPTGKSAIDVLREAIPDGWIWMGAVALVAWTLIRLIVLREDVVGRALLARDCARRIRAQRAELWVVLRDANPLAKIAEIQKSIDDTVQDAIKNRVWAWDPLPPAAEMARELQTDVDEIRAKFMAKWAPPPAGVA